MHIGAARLVLAAGLAIGPAAAHGQAPPDAATVQRLNAVAATLFSPQGAAPDVLTKAIAESKAILAGNPSSAEAHFLLGAAYAISGSADMLGEAKAELRQALALRPGLLQARVYLAGVYMQLGRAGLAQQELTAALEQAPGHPELLTQLAEAQRQNGDAAAALATADRALAANPAGQQAHYHRALALIDLGRPADAIAELVPLAAADVPEARVYVALGRLQIDAKQLAAARATLERGVALAPTSTDLQVLLARACRLTGALDRAEAALDAAGTAAAPAVASAAWQQTEAALALERGLLRLAQDRPADAIDPLERSVDMRPDSGEAHRALAIACLRAGRAAEAAEHAALAEKLGAPLPAAERARLRAAGGATRR